MLSLNVMNPSGRLLLLFVSVVFSDIGPVQQSSCMCVLVVFTSFLLLFLQCPFIDEYILALHNKIRTKPVEFPET